MRGAIEAGNYAEKIFLKDKKINYCTGCGVCNGTQKCVQRDDMTEIAEKMIKADVIVLASPVYFYTISAQLKTMIDRLNFCYTLISNKEFYYILAAADEEKQSLERAVEGLRGFTNCCLENPVEKGIIYGAGLWNVGEAKNSEYMKQAYEMGQNV